MRRLVALLAIAACGDNLEILADAGVVADADAERDAIDAPPTALDGRWRIRWTCVELCVIDPALIQTDVAEFSGGRVEWTREGCADCAIVHTGSVGASCIDVPAGLDNANDDRDAYRACVDGAALTAEVGVRRVGGVPLTGRWRADGVRL